MNNSIVFIHKSNIKNSIHQQAYIKDVIKYAALTNPNKKIIFIGDNGNKIYCDHPNVIFKNIDNFEKKSLLFRDFDGNFKVVRGKNNPARPQMLKFYFERIIYMYEILSEMGITSYWTFDTDTLILEDLSKHEYKFKDYDCTEQCNGWCMNGYVSNIDTTRRYIEHFISLFGDDEYLNTHQKEFDTINPSYAYTEMRAYHDFKTKNNIKSIDLSTPINGETFDHALAQNFGPNYDDDAITKDIKPDKENLWESSNGRKVIYEKEDGVYFKLKNELFKVITVNLSWLPTSLFTEIYNKSIKNKTVV